MEALRNLTRRKLRTALTVFGIAIGIFALSVMGSLSEYLNSTVDASIKYSGDIIRVLPRSALAGLSSGAIKQSAGDILKTIPHVKEVSGGIILPLNENSSAPSNPFNSKFVLAVDPAMMADIFQNVPLESGRYLQSGDSNAVVLGHNIANGDNLSVGATQEIRGTKIKVVGIFKPTQSSQIDDYTILAIKEAQAIANLGDVVNFFIVVPDDAKNAQAISDQINKDYSKQFSALSPDDVKKTAQQALLIFTVITVAGAALAAVVGGFSTINTMIMSVSERTKEIGIKKAVGASNGQIRIEFLIESALIGLLGGLIGLGLGKLATLVINYYTKQYFGGLEIFNLSPRLALLSLGFAILLGGLAGIIPAISASRLNIVKALRTE